MFDVGETLVDETRVWAEIADGLGVPRFTFAGVIGGLAARGEPHQRVYELLGVEPRRGGSFEPGDLYDDARRASRSCGAAATGSGSPATRAKAAYDRIELDVDFVASSADWGVEKPAPAFFARVVEACGCRAGADRLRRRPRRQRRAAVARGRPAAGSRAPRPVGLPARSARGHGADRLAGRAAGGAGACLTSASASAWTRTRSRRACRSCSAGSSSTTRAASPATPTATSSRTR